MRGSEGLEGEGGGCLITDGPKIAGGGIKAASYQIRMTLGMTCYRLSNMTCHLHRQRTLSPRIRHFVPRGREGSSLNRSLSSSLEGASSTYPHLAI
jgi:hypothetical protein